MNLTPNHWPRRPGEGPINAKPIVFWTPRELRPRNEAVLGGAGFTLAVTPYTSPALFKRLMRRPHTPEEMAALHPEIDDACLGIWRSMVKAGRTRMPEVVVWHSLRSMFRPMVDAIYRETGGYSIIVTTAGEEQFIRVLLESGRMRYMEWLPDVNAVLERRRRREQQRREGSAA